MKSSCSPSGLCPSSSSRRLLGALLLGVTLISLVQADDRMSARIDLSSSAKEAVEFEVLELSPGARVSWTDDTHQRCAVHIRATTAWQQGSITLKPKSSGRIALLFIGPYVQADTATRGLLPVFMHYDNVTVEPAAIYNGGFEKADATGAPAGWFPSNIVKKDSPPLPPELTSSVKTSPEAAEGRNYLRAWHNSRFGQTISVQAGVPVKISFSFRSEK